MRGSDPSVVEPASAIVESSIVGGSVEHPARLEFGGSSDESILASESQVGGSETRMAMQ